MKRVTINVLDIDYCVEWDDILDPDNVTPEDVKESLPKSLDLIIEYDPEEEELEELICDKISDETGWLVYGYSYEVIKEENV